MCNRDIHKPFIIIKKKNHRHPLNKFSPELPGSLIQNEKMGILFQK